MKKRFSSKVVWPVESLDDSRFFLCVEEVEDHRQQHTILKQLLFISTRVCHFFFFFDWSRHMTRTAELVLNKRIIRLILLCGTVYQLEQGRCNHWVCWDMLTFNSTFICQWCGRFRSNWKRKLISFFFFFHMLKLGTCSLKWNDKVKNYKMSH